MEVIQIQLETQDRIRKRKIEVGVVDDSWWKGTRIHVQAK